MNKIIEITFGSPFQRKWIMQSLEAFKRLIESKHSKNKMNIKDIGDSENK